jgi:hypothetical protein
MDNRAMAETEISAIMCEPEPITNLESNPSVRQVHD